MIPSLRPRFADNPKEQGDVENEVFPFRPGFLPGRGHDEVGRVRSPEFPHSIEAEEKSQRPAEL